MNYAGSFTIHIFKISVILLVTLQPATCQEVTTEDFKVDCIRPLGMRITPGPNFRVLQTGCRGQETNILLEPPYDVNGDCLVATDTGTAVQIILEDATSSSNLVGGFMSRVFVVSCDFPGTDGYEETLKKPMPAIRQPAGVDPTATSGVFKFTGILMAIVDKATFAAARWAEHLVSSAFIGQELYLTISHPQRDEGQAFIIPRRCRVKPETGNFTTIWSHTSEKRRCYEVSGIAREPIRVFTDTKTNDVMSLQFFGFQFLGYENDVITFECDLLLCGDISGGTCQNEWKSLQTGRECITSKPPRKLSPQAQGMTGMTMGASSSLKKRSPQRTKRRAPVRRFNFNTSATNFLSDYDTGRGVYRLQQETVRVNIRMMVPRTRLQHVASGNRILPSSAAALLLTMVVRIFQDG